jgi:hypothetical protein
VAVFNDYDQLLEVVCGRCERPIRVDVVDARDGSPVMCPQCGWRVDVRWARDLDAKFRSVERLEQAWAEEAPVSWGRTPTRAMLG